MYCFSKTAQILGDSPRRICGLIKLGRGETLAFVSKMLFSWLIWSESNNSSVSSRSVISCSKKHWKPHHSAPMAVSHTFTSPLNVSSALSVPVERLNVKSWSLYRISVSLWERVWICPFASKTGLTCDVVCFSTRVSVTALNVLSLHSHVCDNWISVADCMNVSELS